jgi:hypothetical protein
VGAGDSGHELLRFNPALGVWSSLATTLQDRYYGASFVLGGYLYAAGGEASDPNVERYDVVSDTWMEVADMEGRAFFCTVTIGSVCPAEVQDLFDSLIAKACN